MAFEIQEMTVASTIEKNRMRGLQLRALTEGFSHFVRSVQGQPPLSWLLPAVSIKLIRRVAPPEQWIVCADTMRLRANAKEFKFKFQAQEIPDEILLWRTVAFPHLTTKELTDAVALSVQSHCPFPLSDLVWGYQTEPANPNGGVSVLTVMASRTQIEKHFSQQLGEVPEGMVPEAWAVPAGRQPIVVAGFGEKARIGHARLWQKVNYFLAFIVFCILAGIALTPSLQLRLRAIEAQSAFEIERRTVEPLVKKRAAYQEATERLSEIALLTRDRVDPLWLMDRITQIMPDDTSVFTLQAQAAKVTITGQTPNAASLMQHLSSQSDVRDVKAPIASVRPPGAQKDTFNIEFSFVPQVAVSSPQSPLPANTASAASASSQAPTSVASAPSMPASKVVP